MSITLSCKSASVSCCYSSSPYITNLRESSHSQLKALGSHVRDELIFCRIMSVCTVDFSTAISYRRYLVLVQSFPSNKCPICSSVNVTFPGLHYFDN